MTWDEFELWLDLVSIPLILLALAIGAAAVFFDNEDR
jgi:L-asparagine transporter-like permease